MFADDVCYDGVDVSDENGLVIRGIIRGKAPNADGFIVDFDYSGHSQDFVPFDHCANHDTVHSCKIGDVVEVLHRSAPNEPWRWYPAKLLAGSPDRFAFVGIDIGEAVVEKVVPLDALRTGNEPKLSGLQISSEYFAPLDLLDESPIARKRFPMFTYLNNVPLVNGEQVSEVVPSDALADDTVRQDNMEINQFDLMDDPGSITAQLSLNVMREIFFFLTPDERVACRKLCQMWNFVLTSMSSTYRVEIEISTVWHRELATVLHKTVTGSTKVLVLSGRSGRQQHSTIQLLYTVATMLKAMNLNIKFIVLSRTRVEAEELSNIWCSADLEFILDDVCGTLILNDVGVCLPNTTRTSLVIRKEVLDAKVPVGVERVLEKWCPGISGPEMDLLQEKLRLLWERDEVDVRWELWMLLTKYQPADERFHPYDDGNFPPAGTLGVPALVSLRKLTVWALTGYCQSKVSLKGQRHSRPKANKR